MFKTDNINKILIKEGYDKIKVLNLCNYLEKMYNEYSNKDKKYKNRYWMDKTKESEFIYFFKKVAEDGLYIDGDTVMYSYRGTLGISLSYHAYKNLVLMRYPESTFDIELVREGDTFSFKKESGKIIYSHNIGFPFEDKKIIGAYGIIKNRNGEFLERLNPTDISKIRRTAKTDMIWKQWESEMTLKSMSKRLCKRHYKDIFTNLEKLDNENYDLDKLEIKESESNINTEEKDRPLALFSELVKDFQNKDELINEFRGKNNADRQDLYREALKEIKKQEEEAKVANI